MQLASLIGFGMVFLVIAWSLSIALRLGLWASRPWIQRLGPAAERRAVEAAVLVPFLAATLIVAILVLRSHFGVHHCEEHAHHVHLCLEHGANWTEQVWVTMTALVVFTTVACRALLMAVSVVRQQRCVTRLRAVSQRRDGIWWIDTDQALCFVSGFFRPQIYVSRAVWEALDADERSAMLAHEQDHVAHRDVARRLAFDLLSLLGAPFVARLRHTWESATERVCDARATAATGDGGAVASALVKVYRLGARAPFAPAGFTPSADMLTERVNAALADAPTGDRAAHRLLAVTVAILVAIVVIAALEAEALHHLLESLLG